MNELIEEVTAHAQSDSLEDAQEICTYFPNNLRILPCALTCLYCLLSVEQHICHCNILTSLTDGYKVIKKTFIYWIHLQSLLLSATVDAELHEVFVPEFNGDSYLELPKLEGVGRAFSLEVWFMSREPDGLLLYNGQLTNGKGDFICIHLINGHVQFRFDLGSGAANLT